VDLGRLHGLMADFCRAALQRLKRKPDPLKDSALSPAVASLRSLGQDPKKNTLCDCDISKQHRRMTVVYYSPKPALAAGDWHEEKRFMSPFAREECLQRPPQLQVCQ